MKSILPIYNPWKYWWVIRRYFTRPDIKWQFSRISGLYPNYFWFGIKLISRSIVWERGDTPRFISDPEFKLVLFNTWCIKGRIGWHEHNKQTWETILSVVEYDKKLYEIELTKEVLSNLTISGLRKYKHERDDHKTNNN